MGKRFMFLGSELVLRLAEGGPRTQPRLLEDDTLVVCVAGYRGCGSGQAQLEAWYRAEARRHFVQRLEHYGHRMGWRQGTSPCRVPALAGEAATRTAISA